MSVLTLGMGDLPLVNPRAMERAVQSTNMFGEPLVVEDFYSPRATTDWIFDRAIPAGRDVILCFHDINKPGEELQLPFRREEAEKLAKAIIGGAK